MKHFESECLQLLDQSLLHHLIPSPLQVCPVSQPVRLLPHDADVAICVGPARPRIPCAELTIFNFSQQLVGGHLVRGLNWPDQPKNTNYT